MFSYFLLNSRRNRFHWLTNYSHYLTNPRPIQLHASHFIHLNQPLKDTTLLNYSHTPDTHKKLYTRLVHRRPNIRSCSVLSDISLSLSFSKLQGSSAVMQCDGKNRAGTGGKEDRTNSFPKSRALYFRAMSQLSNSLAHPSPCNQLEKKLSHCAWPKTTRVTFNL